MDIEIVLEPWQRTLYGYSGTVENEDYSGAGRRLMDAMWQEISEKSLQHKGINHWVYDSPDELFVGVELVEVPDSETGLERRDFLLPTYAYWKHIGPYSQLGAVHSNIHNALGDIGYVGKSPAVEVYGHWTADEELMETEILIPVHEAGDASDDRPLTNVLRHNLWANLRLLDACAALNEEQLAASATGGYGTLYKTLRHIVSAELRYLEHLTGRPSERLPLADNPELATLRDGAHYSGTGLIGVAETASAADRVNLEWDEKRWPIPAGMILTQAINHATGHREQIMTVMTRLGVEPPDLSGWAYIEETVVLTSGAE